MATFCLLSAAKLTSRWIPPKHAGFVMGGVITLAMIGGMLAQKLPNLTLIFNSWQKSISAVAILGLFFWLLILFFVQNAPKNQNQNKNPTSLQNTEQNTEHFNHRNKFYIIFFKALFNRQTWLSGIYSNFLSLPIILLGALWAKDYLITSYHETLNSAEYNISLIFLGVLIGCPLAGWISDRLKKRKAPMIIGAFLTLLTALFLITERTLSPLEIGLDFFLMGIFSGSQAITFALLIESNPLHSTALAESIGAMIIMSAGAIFQPLFGYLLERNWDGKMLGNTPLYTPANFHMALWILPITFAASVLIALFIKETHCKNMNL